jgi:arylsulfatase A-like enzyme
MHMFLKQRHCWLAGACFGAIAGLSYGVIELACLAVLPAVVQPGYEYQAYGAAFSALCLLLYAGGGGLMGLLSGSAPRWFPEWQPAPLLRAIPTAGLTLLLLASLFISWKSWRFPPLILAAALVLLLAATAASIGNGALARRAAPFAAAWLPCACYLLSFWVSAWLRDGAVFYVILLLAALCLIAWLAAKVAPAPSGIVPWRSLAGVAILATACWGAAAWLRPVAFTAQVAPKSSAPGMPNVILIVLDTVRADHLSVYGYERNTSPNLKHLAAESTVFTRAISSSDVSLPTHASMFTGLYPSQHRAHFLPSQRIGVPLESRFVTLAEMLSAKGFWTAGVVANGGYVSVAFGLQQGFEYWDQRLPAMTLAPLPDAYLRSRIRNLVVRFLPTSEWHRMTRSAAEVNHATLSALAGRPKTRPFFLFLNYMDAHVPYIPPAPYNTMFPGRDAGFTESRYLAAYMHVMAGNRKVGEGVRAHLVSQYDGGIAYLDAQIGLLVGRLKELGLYDNSLILITSDHGEAHGERNYMDHGGMSLYEDQIHVPLIVKYPNRREAAVVDQPASTVDLLPTVLDVAGLPVPDGMPGMSLRHLAGSRRGDVLSESFPGGRAYFANRARFDRSYRSVISASLKYIAGSASKSELYDVPRDPAESRNLFDLNDGHSQAFVARLRQWNVGFAQQGRGAGRVDNSAIERLRSLGYVQ